MTPARRQWLAALVIVAAQALLLAIVTSKSYFQKDDFPNFAFARTETFRWEYLNTPVFQHFAPGHRLGNMVVERWVYPAHRPIIAVVVGAVAVMTLLTFAIARALWGPRWWTVWLVAVAGLPLLIVPSLLWFASGLHVLPSLLAVLTGILAYLHWLADRRLRWIAVILAAFSVGLMFYIKTIFLLAYLPFIRLLFLEEHLSPRRIVAALWADRLLYAALAVPAVAYAAYYSAGEYGDGQVQFPPVADVVAYLRIAWLRGFVPAIFGWRVPETASGTDDVVVLLGQLVLVAALVVSFVRKRAAWRGWAFLLFTFLLIAVVAGAPRIPLFGVRIGYDQRYYAEAVILLPLALALVFTRGRVAPLALRETRAASVAVLAGTRRRWWVPVLAAASVVALAFSWWEGARRLNVEYLGDDAQAFVEKLDAGLATVRRTPGATVLDGQLPDSIVDLASPVFDRRSIMFGLIAPPAPKFGLGEKIYDVSMDGAVNPVRFVPEKVLGRTRCGDEREQVLDVRIPPLPFLPQRYVLLDVRVDRPGTAGFRIAVNDEDALVPAPAVSVKLKPGQRQAIADLPLFVKTDRLRAVLPPGSCATRVAIGAFLPA